MHTAWHKTEPTVITSSLVAISFLFSLLKGRYAHQRETKRKIERGKASLSLRFGAYTYVPNVFFKLLGLGPKLFSQSCGIQPHHLAGPTKLFLFLFFFYFFFI